VLQRRVGFRSYQGLLLILGLRLWAALGVIGERPGMRGPLQVEGRTLYRAHHIYLAAVEFLAYRPLYTQQFLAFAVEEDLVILSRLPNPQDSEDVLFRASPLAGSKRKTVPSACS
jgi:hypothetical protein